LLGFRPRAWPPWRGRKQRSSASERLHFCIVANARRLRKLNVNSDHTATLTCENGNGNAVYRNGIEYPDFSLPEITLYFTSKVILLPSEY
jgi:hypothetical protein